MRVDGTPRVGGRACAENLGMISVDGPVDENQLAKKGVRCPYDGSADAPEQ